jgi:hypothetical protein
MPRTEYHHQSPFPARVRQLALRLAEGLLAFVEPVAAPLAHNLVATGRNHPAPHHHDYLASATQNYFENPNFL